ncbi:hypothetical protein FH972_023168 [Carpinus fangiana]|uniref:Geranylgeranyl pyrophosphate synthase n=1 Tax=Carpinus fangiana TaxID=176857 RepID=A0A5N6KUD5_9ROSI|nr:hypothetical protein FH972_023168 [Carpinus fangiana]
MVHGTDNPLSPNEIPPRFSSAGVRSPKKAKPVPRPLSEESWLASAPPSTLPNGHSSPPPEYRTAMPSPQNSPPRTNGQASKRGRNAPLHSHPDPTNIGADLIYQRKAQWSPQKESILLGPYEYMFGHPGKDIRSQMIAAFNTWLRVPPTSLDIITKVVGMLHTASLLVDDVEDSSNLRRGVPVAHAIFGTAQTINSANYVYFLALKELGKLNNPRAIDVYADEMVNLHRGQGMDLWWRDSLTCPSEDDYLEMVSNKTGGLFRLAVKLMQAEASNSAFALSPHVSGSSTPLSPSPVPHQEHDRLPTTTSTGLPSSRPQGSSSPNPVIPLVNTIGLLFQILDDYQNLASTIYTANKGLAEDLTEGKFSFPVAHAVRTNPANQILPNILKQRTKDDDVKRYAVRYIEGTGSFSYTREVLKVLDARAMSLVAEVDAWDAQTTANEEAGFGQRNSQHNSVDLDQISGRKGDDVRKILERLKVVEPPHINGDGEGSSSTNE